MLMGQLPQLANFSKNLIRREEMGRAADLDLSPHIDPATGAGENHAVDCIISAVNTTASVGAYCLNRDALILGIDDVLPLGNSTDQIPPLCMEETGIEREILPVR